MVLSSHQSKELGDSVVLGASSPMQLARALQTLKDGPLDETVVTRIDAIWEVVREGTTMENLNDAV